MTQDNTAPEAPAPETAPIEPAPIDGATATGGLAVAMPRQPGDDAPPVPGLPVALPLDAPRDPFARKAIIDVQEPADRAPAGDEIEAAP